MNQDQDQERKKKSFVPKGPEVDLGQKTKRDFNLRDFELLESQ
jgi:hypothetical protein